MNTVIHVPHFWQLCTFARKTGEPVARETKDQNLEPFKGWNRMARLELNYHSLEGGNIYRIMFRYENKSY